MFPLDFLNWLETSKELIKNTKFFALYQIWYYDLFIYKMRIMRDQKSELFMIVSSLFFFLFLCSELNLISFYFSQGESNIKSWKWNLPKTCSSVKSLSCNPGFLFTTTIQYPTFYISFTIYKQLMRFICYTPVFLLHKKIFIHPRAPTGVTLMAVIVSARLANPAAPCKMLGSC